MSVRRNSHLAGWMFHLQTPGPGRRSCHHGAATTIIPVRRQGLGGQPWADPGMLGQIKKDTALHTTDHLRLQALLTLFAEIFTSFDHSTCDRYLSLFKLQSQATPLGDTTSQPYPSDPSTRFSHKAQSPCFVDNLPVFFSFQDSAPFQSLGTKKGAFQGSSAPRHSPP